MRSDVGVDIEHTESYKGFPSPYTITLMLDDIKELPNIILHFFHILELQSPNSQRKLQSAQKQNFS